MVEITPGKPPESRRIGADATGPRALVADRIVALTLICAALLTSDAPVAAFVDAASSARPVSLLTWIKQNDELAAWIQAVGTLVALGLSVWTTMHASRVANRLAARPTVVFLDVVERTVVAANKDWLEPYYSELWRAAEFLGYQPSAEHKALKRLLELPLVEWPDLDLQTHCAEIDRVLNILVEGMRTWPTSEYGNGRAYSAKGQGTYRSMLIQLRFHTTLLEISLYRARASYGVVPNDIARYTEERRASFKRFIAEQRPADDGF